MISIINPERLKLIFPGVVFRENTCFEKKVFFTFDDGPDPIATPYVLEELKKYHAKATFFLIGKNAEKFSDLQKEVYDQGHSLGNHTYSHISGWSCTQSEYFKDVCKCSEIVDSKLFRPPYGRIYPWQSVGLQRAGYKVVMWDLMTYDFNIELLSKKTLGSMPKRIKPGSILVFHDTQRALKTLCNILPEYLEYCAQEGFSMEALL